MLVQEIVLSPVDAFNECWDSDAFHIVLSEDESAYDIFQDFTGGNTDRINNLIVGHAERYHKPSNGKRLIIRRIARDDYVFVYHSEDSTGVILLASLDNHGRFNAPLTTEDVRDILMGSEILHPHP